MMGNVHIQSAVPCAPIGAVLMLGFDKHGREHRRKLAGAVSCEACGRLVELWAETDCWRENEETLLHHHSGYSVGGGVCCGREYRVG